MRRIHPAPLFWGALLAVLAVAASPALRADEFDLQKYFEEKAKESLREQERLVLQRSAASAPPLSGGASEISTVSYGIWIALGIAGGVAAAFVILWLKTPVFHFAPRVDDAIDKEFRAMIRETGEESGYPGDAGAPSRRTALREDDIIEDLTGERDEGAGGPAEGMKA